MFVVSGHLYRPLPSSQPCGLKVKIQDGFGTRQPTFLGAGLSILVFLWHLSPVGSAMWRGLSNRSDTYSFVLRAFPTPFAHVLTLIYFGVGSSVSDTNSLCALSRHIGRNMLQSRYMRKLDEDPKTCQHVFEYIFVALERLSVPKEKESLPPERWLHSL